MAPRFQWQNQYPIGILEFETWNFHVCKFKNFDPPTIYLSQTFYVLQNKKNIVPLPRF